MKGKNVSIFSFGKIIFVFLSQQIIQLIFFQKTKHSAQASKAPIQSYADRMSGYFVPAVVTLSLLTFGIWFGLVRAGKVDSSTVDLIAPGLIFFKKKNIFFKQKTKTKSKTKSKIKTKKNKKKQKIKTKKMNQTYSNRYIC